MNRGPARDNGRLLLVEDDGRIGGFLERELSALGFEVVVTEDAEVGEFLAATEAFDLAIIDLGSRPGTGLGVLHRLRAERLQVPVIAVTAGDEPDSRAAVLHAGASTCLTRPIVFEELCECVTHYISARGNGTARAGANGASAIWALTDVSYLEQRMPMALVEWLEADGRTVHLAVADRGQAVSRLTLGLPAPPGSPWEGISAGDLVVTRSRHPFALALLEEAEARGARTVNPASAVRRVRNKVRGTLALAKAGLPVPDTFVAQSPRELRRLPRRAFPLVLKPLGDNGHGIRVVHSVRALERLPWPDPIVLAQPYIDAARIDLKVYVAGEAVWAVRRGSSLGNGHRAHTRTSVDTALRDLALACGAIFGLRLYGLDLVESDTERLVVDVNEFPNYAGVDEAPAAIGRLLLHEALSPQAEQAAEARL